MTIAFLIPTESAHHAPVLVSLFLTVFLFAGLSSADETQEITVKRGSEFTINLKENPSTGYQWTPHVGNKIIRMVDRSYRSDSDRIGAGGVVTFTFQAESSGGSVITFKYERPWENKAVKTRTYIVTVED